MSLIFPHEVEICFVGGNEMENVWILEHHLEPRQGYYVWN